MTAIGGGSAGRADGKLSGLVGDGSPLANDLSWTGAMHPAVYITIGLLIIAVPLFLFLIVYRKPVGPREDRGLESDMPTHWSERGYGDGIYGDAAFRRAHAEGAQTEGVEITGEPADAGYRAHLLKVLTKWRRSGTPGERPALGRWRGHDGDVARQAQVIEGADVPSDAPSERH
ncbi:MAG: hypothetical protein AAF416_12155 [Pseudomonadota bacterium]